MLTSPTPIPGITIPAAHLGSQPTENPPKPSRSTCRSRHRSAPVRFRTRSAALHSSLWQEQSSAHLRLKVRSTNTSDAVERSDSIITTDGFIRDKRGSSRILQVTSGSSTAFPIHIMRKTFQKQPPNKRGAHHGDPRTKAWTPCSAWMSEATVAGTLHRWH